MSFLQKLLFSVLLSLSFVPSGFADPGYVVYTKSVNDKVDPIGRALGGHDFFYQGKREAIKEIDPVQPLRDGRAFFLLTTEEDCVIPMVFMSRQKAEEFSRSLQAGKSAFIGRCYHSIDATAEQQKQYQQEHPEATYSDLASLRYQRLQCEPRHSAELMDARDMISSEYTHYTCRGEEHFFVKKNVRRRNVKGGACYDLPTEIRKKFSR